MRRPAIPAVLLILGASACRDGQPEPTPAPAASKTAATPNQAAPAEPTQAPAEPTQAPAAKPETFVPQRQWLVWHAQGDGFVTRWVADDGKATRTLAERGALVHAAGERLQHIARRDATVDVKTCGCFEEGWAAGEDCSTTGSIVVPGLAATDLSSGAAHDLVTPSTEAIFGEVYGLSLSIAGGIDGKLIVRTADSGYYCGAHGSYGGSDAFIAVGEPGASAWPTPTLPRTVRQAAATGEMFDRYRDCEGDPTLTIDRFVDEAMRLSSVSMALDDGEPRITWGFSADVYYVCSPDYETHGETTTGLLPEASTLGLAGPLPEGLTRALAEIGDARVVGWSEITADATRSAELLAKFSAVAQAPWPTAESTTRETKASAPASARDSLAEGRKRTRSGDLDAAIAAFDAAIAADDRLARAWAERCYAKLLAGQLDAAEADCKAALPLDDGHAFQAAVHYNLGQIAQKRGDAAAAKAAYRRSLDLRPTQAVQKAHDAL